MERTTTDKCLAKIVYIDFAGRTPDSAGTIDINRVIASKRQLSSAIIQSASTTEKAELAEEHTSEPIKSIEDIDRISAYLVQNGRYRDNMLFILGINFGLRVSDLVQLRFNQLIDEQFCFKTTFPILEKKTSKTRKVPKNRYITINEAVMDAVTLYLQHSASQGTAIKLDDYMFRSESNRGCNQNKPMSRVSVDRILKGIAEDLQLQCKVATHTLRKTFGYHQMVMSGNDPRKLLLLQKIFGHSSSTQTLEYIGITREEIEEAYTSLNLGSRNCYASFGAIEESESVVLAE